MSYIKPHSRRRKSQITMFVLLGLVMLIVVVLLLFLKDSLAPKRWGIQEILHELEVGRIKNHITDCMSDIGMEAVRHIADNGGLIYDYQGGRIPYDSMVFGDDYLNYFFIDKTYYVAYGLKKNSLCSQIDNSTLGYPFPDVPFTELSFIYLGNCSYDSPTGSSAYDGFFGQSVMPKLCYVTRETSCQGFAKGLVTGFTIQAQLEDYIIKRLPICTNFSSFAERMGVVEILPEGDPVVEVDVQAARIITVVKYPVKIVFQNNDPISKILNYHSVLNVRLAGLYHFAYNVLSRDSKRIDWSVKDNYISSYYWMPGFSVNKINNPCPDCPEPYNQDDILEFVDAKSFVFGRPLAFRVAVENRRPAIDFIPSLAVDLATASAIDIPFIAHDPDDEPLKYYFLSFGTGDVVCSGNEPFIPPPNIAFGESGSNLNGANGWCEADSRVMESLPYSRIWAPIGIQDIGRHEVGLLVIDDSGLFDFQVFWINISLSQGNDAGGDCLFGCLNAGIDDSTCQARCLISANECFGECDGGRLHDSSFGGGGFELVPIDLDGDGVPDDWVDVPLPDPGEGCGTCIEAVMAAQERYVHADCGAYGQADCINNMPDCFWVRESHDDGWGNTWFIDSCINDYGLGTLNQPSYILV